MIHMRHTHKIVGHIFETNLGKTYVAYDTYGTFVTLLGHWMYILQKCGNIFMTLAWYTTHKCEVVSHFLFYRDTLLSTPYFRKRLDGSAG